MTNQYNLAGKVAKGVISELSGRSEYDNANNIMMSMLDYRGIAELGNIKLDVDEEIAIKLSERAIGNRTPNGKLAYALLAVNAFKKNGDAWNANDMIDFADYIGFDRKLLPKREREPPIYVYSDYPFDVEQERVIREQTLPGTAKFLNDRAKVRFYGAPGIPPLTNNALNKFALWRAIKYWDSMPWRK